MKRFFSILVLALVAVAPLMAQSPKGWMVRADGRPSATDPDGAGAIKFITEGSGFRATNPRASVYWNPANTAAGTYSLKGTFTVLKPTSHSEYYGLIFGGSDLEGAKQSYIYFMVALDGTWLIKRRDGDATQEMAGPTANDAVKVADASGKSTNALEVRVMADKIEFVVNGKVVNSMPKTGKAAKTDGITGIRINHLLEVQVDGFALAKQ